jgi:hypothetical protein
MNTLLMWAGFTALLMPAFCFAQEEGAGPAEPPPQAPGAPVPGPAEEGPAGRRENPLLSWNFLWAGAWEDGGNLTNRGDLKLHLEGPGLSLRGEFLDRRPGDFEALSAELPWESGKGSTNFLGGIYHGATGSRILYGPLEEWGLAARLRSPWSRALPFAESRKASMAELRTSPSGKEPELYAYLGSPLLGVPGFGGAGAQMRASAAVRLDPAKLASEPEDSGGANPRPPLGEGTALSAALEGRLGKIAALSIEGFYTGASMPTRQSSGWFSESPPLPSGDFRFYGAGLLLSVPYASLGGDIGWSHSSIRGRDLYANLGLRVGNRGASARPGGLWQLSLAADGAGRHYTGNDGSSPGAGFRAGGKFEWRQSRAGLFRINTGLSGPGLSLGSGGLEAYFNRSSSGFYYRPPAAALPLRLSRLSIGADRDAREPGALRDSVELGLSLAASPQGIAAAADKGPLAYWFGSPAREGALTLNLSGSLTGSPAGGWGAGAGEAGGGLTPWPVPRGPYRFESLKAGGQLGWSGPVDLPFPLHPPGKAGGRNRGSAQIKAGLSYARSAGDSEEEPFKESREMSLQAALRGGRGRFSVTLRCPGFPLGLGGEAEAPELSLSWRIQVP